jgi:hypothetical protein
MRYLAIQIVLILLFIGAGLAQTQTVSGYVIDSENGETLIGVTILNKGTNQGTTTDGNGFFRLTGVKSGEATLIFSFVGYTTLEETILVSSRSILLEAIRLTPESFELKDVVIIGKKHDIVGDSEVETSQQRISAQTILNIPSARGDIFKAIKFLPGIDATEPFSPLYTARGSDPSGNLVMLDGVAIYNPYHYEQSGGLFNIQSVKNIDVLVGGFGAEFGGRNASILYITTKDGTLNKLRGEVEPTTTHTKLFLEFPVGEKSSMMLAGRYYYDIPGYFLFGSKSYFYDFNISYTNRINERNRLTLKVFNSFDDMKFNPSRMFNYINNSFKVDFYEDTHMKLGNSWSNRAATAYLKTIISPNIYLHTQVYGSFHSADNLSTFDMSFRPDTSDLVVGLYYSTQFTSKINDLSAKSVLSIKTDSINTFKVGVEYNSYHFTNGAVINMIDKGQNKRNPSLFAAFIEDKIKIKRFIVRPGIRVSNYSLFKDWQIEPRVNMMITWPYDWKIKAAWGVYHQSIISMNTQEYEINQFLDYYYPLKDIEPSKSVHYIAGFEKPLSRNSTISLEAYFIDMPITYTFNLNQSELEAHSFSDKLERGSGKSYGVEIMYRGDFSKLSGWASYGLSRSTRSYSHIMNGESFLFDFDRTHTIKTMISYRIAPRLTYNFSLVALSGLPKTVETAMQNYYYYDPITGNLAFYPFGVADVKNNARLPWTIDIDMGVLKRIRSGFAAELQEFLKADESYYTISIGNILFFRRNVMWYFPFGGEKYIPIGINFLPSISAGYVIKF